MSFLDHIHADPAVPCPDCADEARDTKLRAMREELLRLAIRESEAQK